MLLLLLHVLFTIILTFPHPLERSPLGPLKARRYPSLACSTVLQSHTHQRHHYISSTFWSHEAFCFRKTGLWDFTVPLSSLQKPSSFQFSLDGAHDWPHGLHPSYSCLTDTHLLGVTSLSDFQMNIFLLSPLLPPLALPRGSWEATTKL